MIKYNNFTKFCRVLHEKQCGEVNMIKSAEFLKNLYLCTKHQRYDMEYQEPRMNESAEHIGFVECRMKGNAVKWVMQLPYPQCYFQVYEFESTQHYLDTLGKSQQWVHAQVGSRTMALTFNGCMMHYAFDQGNASERARQLIDTLKEAAKWYDEFLKSKE